MSENVRLKIQRREVPGGKPYWEEFDVRYRDGMNVISALMDIQENPVNAKGERTTPVAWECSCLEEVCGACSMRVNGRARQACTALIKTPGETITLQPLTKFPVLRDLVVDRLSMFEALKRVKAWTPIDGTHDMGPGPRLTPDEQQVAYQLSRCMTCGCCLEACPQVNSRSPFIGPSAVGQVRLFGIHPTARTLQEERLRTLMGPGGVADCGNAQNCAQVCPKQLPLLESFAEVNRQVTYLSLFGRLKRI